MRDATLHTRARCLVVLTLMCAAGNAGLAAAQAATPAVVKPDTIASALARVEQEVAALRAKVEHPPKDGWDKLGTLSGLVSGVLVAAIGAYATWMYNRRQDRIQAAQHQRDQEQKARELETLNIQTTERFLPYLAGTNERQKEAALAILMLLSKGEFARRLAIAFPGPGVLAAATRLSDPLTVEFANSLLTEIFGSLRLSVVGVGVGADVETPTEGWPNGLIVSNDGLVVTIAGSTLDLNDESLFLELDSRVRVPARRQAGALDSRLSLVKAQRGRSSTGM